MIPVTNYSAAIDIKNHTYTLLIQLKDGPPSRVSVATAEEFAAMLFMLTRKDVAWDPINHSLDLPDRPAGS